MKKWPATTLQAPGKRERCALAGSIGAALVIGAMACGVAADSAAAQDRKPSNDAGRAARETPVSRVFQQASPAVVNLSTTKIVTLRDPWEDIFNRPIFPPRRYQTHSVGSGFIIHPDGFLVTNAHVVAQAAECKALLADGRELPAEEVAVDREQDIAVMRVRADGPLPHLRLGRSDDLMPGETVVAIGNPMGLGHTVTAGIVSALNRELKFGRGVSYSGLIQIDAPINPGNSGGPLLNVLGEVVGVNSAIRGDAQNIGFAIPAGRVRELLPDLLEIERVRGVVFGARFDGRPRTSSPLESTLHPAGVAVRDVAEGTPAAKAGLHAGDVVTAVDAQPTPEFIDVFGVLRTVPTGKPFTLDVWRRDGQTRQLNLALEPLSGIETQKIVAARFGMRLKELTAEQMSRLGMKRPSGLLVELVERGSPAARAGLSPGHVVEMFGGWPVTTLESLGPLLAQVNRGDGIPFRILQITADGWSREDVVLQAR